MRQPVSPEPAIVVVTRPVTPTTCAEPGIVTPVRLVPPEAIW